MGESKATTDGIRVIAESEYVEERSDREQRRFFFKYQMTIVNTSALPVTLVSRHWIITNAHGKVDEVKGEGVVGEQPRLEPGMAFQYVSACPMETEVGSMRGSYQMEYDDGTTFDAEIGAFTLSTPYAIN